MHQFHLCCICALCAIGENVQWMNALYYESKGKCTCILCAAAVAAAVVSSAEKTAPDKWQRCRQRRQRHESNRSLCVWSFWTIHLLFVRLLFCAHVLPCRVFAETLCGLWCCPPPLFLLLLLLVVANILFQQFNVRRQHEIIRFIRFWLSIQFLHFS